MCKKALSCIIAIGVAITLFTALPVTANAITDSVPYATNIAINGNAEVGDTLTGVYTYNSYISNPESGTIFRWLKSEDPVELYTNYVYTPDSLSDPTSDTIFTLSE